MAVKRPDNLTLLESILWNPEERHKQIAYAYPIGKPPRLPPSTWIFSGLKSGWLSEPELAFSTGVLGSLPVGRALPYLLQSGYTPKQATEDSDFYLSKVAYALCLGQRAEGSINTRADMLLRWLERKPQTLARQTEELAESWNLESMGPTLLKVKVIEVYLSLMQWCYEASKSKGPLVIFLEGLDTETCSEANLFWVRAFLMRLERWLREIEPSAKMLVLLGIQGTKRSLASLSGDHRPLLRQLRMAMKYDAAWTKQALRETPTHRQVSRNL
jgi:hypothetical protein